MMMHGLWLLFPLIFFGKIFWLVILALLIGLLVRGIGRRRWYAPMGGFGPAGVPPVQPSAMDILRQRYARGEIDAATFENMRERLEATERPKQ